MFGFLKRQHHDDHAEIRAEYERIIENARHEKLYTQYGVPDTPAARFQMIILHAVPTFRAYAATHRHKDTQTLFDMIFKDVELSFREIGVGDLSIPKKMRAYMKDFNGAIQAYMNDDQDPVQVADRNIFGGEGLVSEDFAAYIRALCKG